MSFSDLGISEWLVRQCEAFGLKEPTPIQSSCIPKILEGEDCIGCAKTGSGKTLAFALPILEVLSEDPYGIYALVLTPTRELAFQIGDQFLAYGKPINLRLSVIVGGMDMVTQGQELSKKPHIVVATPGRLADHLESCNTFSLSNIKFLVLDEADRLLEGQFDEQMRTIFKSLSTTRQTLLFSATMTDTLEQVVDVTCRKAVLFVDPTETVIPESLQQFYILCPAHVKEAYLLQTIVTFRRSVSDGTVIIFTDTTRNCALLSALLEKLEFENVALHSKMRQRDRLSALQKFKSLYLGILVCTDLASRGLDFPRVDLVLNHSVPDAPKVYIHRVGRTARAGRGGAAISLVTPREINLLRDIEIAIDTRMQSFALNEKKMLKVLTQINVAKREVEMKLHGEVYYGNNLHMRMLEKQKSIVITDEEMDEFFRNELGKPPKESTTEDKKEKRRRN